MSLLLLPYVCGLSLSTEVGARNFTYKFLCKHSLSLYDKPQQPCQRLGEDFVTATTIWFSRNRVSLGNLAEKLDKIFHFAAFKKGAVFYFEGEGNRGKSSLFLTIFC